ncbi:hypothetical protein B0H14DRAFT_3520901 [Mycena olivaceomarginata]|nr:hypothetical protein B0H14DRAFT_3520901 [Mycena olivaceomarginata]
MPMLYYIRVNLALCGVFGHRIHNFDPHTTTWGGSSGWGPTTWPSFPPLSPSSDSELASDLDTDNAGSAVDGPIDYTSNASSKPEYAPSTIGPSLSAGSEWGSTLPLGDVVSGTDPSGEWARISRWGAGTLWNADDLGCILCAPSPLHAGEDSTAPLPPGVQHGFQVDREPIEQVWPALDPTTSMKVIGPGTRHDDLDDLKWTAPDAYRALSAAHPPAATHGQVDHLGRECEILPREIE